MPQHEEQNKVAARYHRLLQSGPPQLESTLESMEMSAEAGAALDTQMILATAKEGLYRIIENYLGDSAELRALADKVLTEGGEALKAVADINEDYFDQSPEQAVQLEVIVQVNGSRPSFLVKEGIPDLDSSPVSSWGSWLQNSQPKLKQAISCVGRIDKQGAHVGTGFLVGPDVVITNRHVLQSIATIDAGGHWSLFGGITIDFGKEFQGYATLNRRNVSSVIFCGDKAIVAPLDHAKLDLALLLLDTSTPFATPVEPLPLLSGSAWTNSGTYVYLIGYPGDPGLSGQVSYGSSLLELLFHRTYGCKRLAPGQLLDYSDSKESWTLTHDVTTLGGNSGSPMVVLGDEFAAAGLHYGGSLNAPRQNWGQRLNKTLDQRNTQLVAATLGECFDRYGVKRTA